ncbi:methylenetetrahydrofolate--tRNA [Sesbania bispinosa]|nr:methylenetetrahydrofolate--tRNA [Sesbania bispinosa]
MGSGTLKGRKIVSVKIVIYLKRALERDVKRAAAELQATVVVVLQAPSQSSKRQKTDLKGVQKLVVEKALKMVVEGEGYQKDIEYIEWCWDKGVDSYFYVAIKKINYLNPWVEIQM